MSWESSAIVYDAALAGALLFGGYQEGGHTWLWDGLRWTVIAGSGPSPRYRHAMAYDTGRGRAVLFGGLVEVGGGISAGPVSMTRLGDTWEWDGVRWRHVADTGPSPRFGHGMAYDTARARTVLFGGDDGGAGPLGMRRDTWEWDGQSWTLVSSDGPGERMPGALMAYDTIRKRTMLIGGDDGTWNLNDSWEWDGTSWSQAPSAPIAPYGGAVA